MSCSCRYRPYPRVAEAAERESKRTGAEIAGVIALDGEGRITNLSPPAKHLLDLEDGIRIHASRLEATYPAENSKLQGMLVLANQVLEHPHQSSGNTLLLSDRSSAKLGRGNR